MLYETIFCPECSYRSSLCEMQKLSDVEFDLSLYDYFPNEPFQIKDIDKYDRIKLTANKLKVRFDKFIPTTDSQVDELKDVFYPLSSFNIDAQNPQNIHKTFPNMRVGLLMTGKDPMLVDFIKSDTWVQKIINKKFDYVFAPNLSFYNNQPSCSTVYNRLLSYKAVYELNESGLPVIPSINFIWKSDLQRYSNWLNECGFNYVYLNVQLVKSAKHFNQLFDYIKLIKKHVKAKLIIVGVLDLQRISELENIGNFFYTNSGIHALSSLKLLWSPTGDYKKVDLVNGGMYYKDVFKRNYRNYISKLNRVLK